jgi:hypothetical protein
VFCGRRSRRHCPKIPQKSRLQLCGAFDTLLFTFAGWWRNWLAHRTVDPVVAGSNPVHPAILIFENRESARIRGFFCLRGERISHTKDTKPRRFLGAAMR